MNNVRAFTTRISLRDVATDRSDIATVIFVTKDDSVTGKITMIGEGNTVRVEDWATAIRDTINGSTDAALPQELPSHLRALLANLIDSLEYIDRCHDGETTGYGVRAERIQAAKNFLTMLDERGIK